MTREEFLELIAEVTQHQCELDDVEVKSAQKGTPQWLYEAISAFANRTGGGVLLFGLDEDRNFDLCGVGDAHKLQEDISSLANSEMEPPLRPEFTVQQIEGKTIVAVEVEELPADKRPCFYKPAGLQKGSYIRVANTNRVMTDYEIFGYVCGRAQPTFDEEIVRGATVEDLNRTKLDEYIVNLKRSRPQASYLNRPFEQILIRLGIAQKDGDVLRPTLAGLLVFGEYPQQFEPQLVITYLQYFGTTETEKGPRGARFLDNQKFEGTVGEMVEAAVNHILAHIRKSSLIEGLYRRDIPEYPEEAIREAIANAVAHRDYSNFVRGSYVQVRLFADRLEVQNPGGLYGSVTEETLEFENSTRNRALMRLLEDVHIVENRGSGIASMIEAMRKANLEPPRFGDKRTSFLVTFRSHTLMGPQAIEWLNQFAVMPLSDDQRVAMVYLKHNSRIAIADYQRLNHVDSVTANRQLRNMVQLNLIEQHSTRRWAHYTLKEVLTTEVPTVPRAMTEEEKVLEYIRKYKSITNAQCREMLGNDDLQKASRILKRMHKNGKLKQGGERRWAKYTLP